MLRQPPSSREPPLWLDMATVHPLADSNMGRERARTQRAMAEFIRDPVSSASAGLRRQPSLQATVNFKKLKYASLVRAATLQANARREKAPVFVPLVVSTLGQVHGLQTVSSIWGQPTSASSSSWVLAATASSQTTWPETSSATFGSRSWFRPPRGSPRAFEWPGCPTGARARRP